MEPRLRILMLSSLLPPEYEGGFEMNVLKIAIALRERGHDVQVVTSEFTSKFTGPREEPEWVHRIFKRANVWDVHAGIEEPDAERVPQGSLAKMREQWRKNLLTIRGMRPLRNTIKIAPENERILRQWLTEQPRFDVGYANLLHFTGLSCTLALTEKGVPLIWHLGDEWLLSYATPRGKQGKILDALEGARYAREKSVDLRNVVLISEFLRQTYLDHGFPASQTSVISRGIEFKIDGDVHRKRRTPPVFFMACRLKAYKGVGVAIRAAANLHAFEPSRAWRLEIAGKSEPEMLAHFENMAAELGVRDRVEFLGQITRAETIERMSSATAFINASVYGEPLGNSILEAMASGTPLIASRVGAIDEMISGGMKALNYERLDDESLSDRMKWVLQNPHEAEELALEGVRRIEDRFTMDRIMEETERYLYSVIRINKAQSA